MTEPMPVHHRSHWHFLYQHRRRHVNRTERELFYGQIVSMAGAVIAGLVLDSQKAVLATVVGVFVILPAIFDLGGAVGGSMGAKISHHLSALASKRTHALVIGNVIHAILLIAAAAIFLGIIGAFIASHLFGADFFLILAITVLAALLSALIGLPLVALVTVGSVRLGFNPDNVVGPIETSIFDSLTIVMIAVAIRLLT